MFTDAAKVAHNLCGAVDCSIFHIVKFNKVFSCKFNWMVWCMMFNATFSNISAILWQSVLLVVGFTSTYAGYWDQFLVLDLIPSWITLKIIKIVFLLVLR